MNLSDIKPKDIKGLLNDYSDLLNSDDYALMTFLSAIRGPVGDQDIKNFPIITFEEDRIIVTPTEWKQAIERLVKYQILNYNPSAQEYSIHPLIKLHYQQLLEKDARLEFAVHEYLFYYYLDAYYRHSIYDTMPLEHIGLLVEAVHHACKCGQYSDAWSVYVEMINAPGKYILTDKLGAYDTALSIMREFFPGGNLEKEPLLSSKDQTCQILSNAGFCLMSLGYLEGALSLFERSNSLDKETKYRIRLSNGYQNLSRLYTYLGDLGSATVAARKGIKAAKSTRVNRQKKIRHQINSMCMLAWALNLRGFLSASGELFREVRVLNQDIVGVDIMTKFRGFFNANYLMMMGNLQEARIIAESNLKIGENSLADISRYIRLLGNLDEAESEYASAAEHYCTALKMARKVARKEILIETLCSMGILKAKHLHDLVGAYSDLSEALKYAKDCSYRIYEVDIRYGLARVFLAEGNIPASRNHAIYAWQMSRSLGYYWGNVEATKLFSTLQPGTDKGIAPHGQCV